MTQKRKVATEVAGTVWKIEAPAGTRVEAEEPILLIECMKMEIPVYAPVAGLVAEIRVAEGETVAEGQIVAEIEI
jgi:acetyl-CoA carboxylase biotin carboxyl carrier protein